MPLMLFLYLVLLNINGLNLLANKKSIRIYRNISKLMKIVKLNDKMIKGIQGTCK